MILLFLSLVSAQTQTTNDLYLELSNRDGIYSCEKLQEAYSDLQYQLKNLVSNEIKPSYVPIRAATCLLELYPQDLETYQDWMDKKETLGLARLTTSKLETLPITISIPLVETALKGENASKLLPRLQKIENKEVQSIVMRHIQKKSGEEQ